MGKQNGAGRIVSTFYDICNKIGKASPATESLKSRIKNTSGGIKTRENDQPEELPNASNSLGQDDNKGEKFDDEKHCKTISGVSMNSNERLSQNENNALHSLGPKTSRGQIEEMSSELADGWNQL